MKIKSFIAFLVLLPYLINAQTIDSLNQQVAPIGGMNAIALTYFKINFTKEQRELIKGKEIEFVYLISPTGKANLESINGVQNSSILDSLHQRTAYLPQFQPRIRNGIAEEAIYFIKMSFPAYNNYQSTIDQAQYTAFKQAKIEDFDYIKMSGNRIDLLFAGLVNQPIGNVSNHLSTGGGMRIHIAFSLKNMEYGLLMNIYGNKLKKDFPLATNRKQFSGPATLMVGISVGRWFEVSSTKRPLNVKIELAQVIQNLTEKQFDNDPEWIQLKGFSPGIVLDYPINFGKKKPTMGYGPISLYSNNLNLHAAIRPLFLDLKSASGAMFELGIGYRLSAEYVEEYRYTKEFLENK